MAEVQRKLWPIFDGDLTAQVWPETLELIIKLENFILLQMSILELKVTVSVFIVNVFTVEDDGYQPGIRPITFNFHQD